MGWFIGGPGVASHIKQPGFDSDSKVRLGFGKADNSGLQRDGIMQQELFPWNDWDSQIGVSARQPIATKRANEMNVVRRDALKMKFWTRVASMLIVESPSNCGEIKEAPVTISLTHDNGSSPAVIMSAALQPSLMNQSSRIEWLRHVSHTPLVNAKMWTAVPWNPYVIVWKLHGSCRSQRATSTQQFRRHQ
ncbi:MAG: hypothetical protein R2811_05650 [Flavobacteriales bacterium]